MKKWISLLCLFSGIVQADILPQPTPVNFNLYLSPTGLDSNNGMSPTQAIKSLSTAQSILKALNPAQNVVIHVASGTYRDQRVVWTFVRPNYLLTIQGEGFSKPIFDGSSVAGTFFIMNSATGQPSNVQLTNLQVQNYWMAVSLNGNYLIPNNYNWNNTISNNVFSNIGNGWNASLPYSYAAVRLYNSRNNKVTGNVFQNIINLGDYDGYIHAIYAASFASSNVITYNTFKNVSGDVIRIRDTSNYNWIGNNKFVSSGKWAETSDWYCYGTECDKQECPSWNNKFDSNTYGLTFKQYKAYTTLTYGPSSMTGCSAPDSTSTRLTSTNSLYSVQ